MKNIKILLGVFTALMVLAIPVAAQETVGKVILATDANYPDAVVSSAVSQKLGVPVLLTDKGQLPQETLSALQEFEPSEVIVVGGPAVISDDVIQELEDSGYTVTRLWGMSRYGTAEEIASHFWPEGSEEALLVENSLGEQKGNILGAAKNLANGKPALPFPKGEIPAAVLNQLREMNTQRVRIVATEIDDGMESNLSDLGIQISERIQAQNEERLQEKIRNRTMEDFESNDTLVVVAAGNFQGVISAPNLPQSKSFLVGSEEEIQDAVDAIQERNITKVKVAGKPDLAQTIADTLENETDAEIDLVVEQAANAVAQAAKIAKQNRPDFVEEFQNKNSQWQQRIQESRDQIKEKANETLQKAEDIEGDYGNEQAQQKIQEAQQLMEQGNYTQTREMARRAMSQIREQRWNQVRNNRTAMHQEIQQEMNTVRQRTQELAQINREFGEQMSQNMTTEERLEVIEEFKDRRRDKVKEIMEQARNRGREILEDVSDWLGEAENRGRAESKCKGKPHAVCVGHWELEDGECAWKCDEVSEPGNKSGNGNAAEVEEVDYSGSWSGSGYSGSWEFTVDHEDEEVTGTFSGDVSGDVSGTVSENTISASGTIMGQEVTWSGEISSDGSSVSGTWETSGVIDASGTWSGQKE